MKTGRIKILFNSAQETTFWVLLKDIAGFSLFEGILRLCYASHQNIRFLMFHAVLDQPA